MAAPRLRKSLAAVVTVVAAAASLASSPPEYYIDAGTAGRVVLSPSNPEVVIPFTVAVSPAAARLGPTRLTVSYELAWTDVDDSVVADGPHVAVESPTETLTPGSGNSIGCWDTCIGSNTLVLRWPAAATSGSVAIRWSINAEIGVLDSAPPDDATITIAADTPPSVPEPILSRFDAYGFGENISVTNIVVTSSRAISGLSVNHIRLHGESTGLVIGQASTWTGVAPQRSLPLEIPAHCLDGPCEFELQAVLPRSGVDGGGAEYELVAMPGEESYSSAVATEAAPWTTSSPASGSITVALSSDDPVATIPVSMWVPVEIGTAPIVAAVTIGIVEIQTDQELEFVLPGLAERRWENPRRNIQEDYDAFEFDLPIPLVCDDTQCRASNDLEITYDWYEDEPFEPATVRFVISAKFLLASEIDGMGIPRLELGVPR